MSRFVDFNCDLGEGMDDAAVMPYISSASVACGFHAGDESTMRDAVALCLWHGVAIGAHPSFADRQNFGRSAHRVTPGEAQALVVEQIRILEGIARQAGTTLQHVKPHGALYNQAAVDRELADAIAGAVHAHDPGLVLYALSGSELTAAGQRRGLRVAHEAFAERRYEADGTLSPRSMAGASIEDTAAAAGQVLRMLGEGCVLARTGERLQLRVDSICLHGDRPDAADFARALHAAILAPGIRYRRWDADELLAVAGHRGGGRGLRPARSSC